MRRCESPLAVVLKGGLAGLVGTFALTYAMERGPRVVEQLAPGLVQEPAAEPEPESESAGSDEAPTEQLAGRIADGVLERPIDRDARETAGQVVHWGYGVAWGAVYGIVQGTFHFPPLLHGTIFGAILAILGWQLEASLRIAPPPTQLPPVTNATVFSAHLLYGWTTALVFRSLSSVG